MGIFGGSYPAGAENDPNAPYNQSDPPCEVCGKDPYYCICPMCPVCKCHGDPSCYKNEDDDHEGHGLILTQDQIDSKKAADDGPEDYDHEEDYEEDYDE